MPTEHDAVATIHANVATSMADDVHFSTADQTHLAKLDFIEGLQKWRIWYLLAYQDIKLRYRRSTLGPFWLTISMAITVYTMGFLYAHLFRTSLAEYYPYLVAGMITWALISSVITDLLDTFTLSDGLIKQIKLPYTLYIHRSIARNFIIFFHNLLVIIPIYFIFSAGTKINLNSLLVIPGLAILYVNAFIYGLILAMLGARYRDISMVIRSLVQIIFFVTPVLWSPNILQHNQQQLVYINPFYSFIELIRAPLLGTAPTSLTWMITTLCTLIGAMICVKMFIPRRSRIIYWL